jgi:flagellar basal-body rod modification protein FlgD
MSTLPISSIAALTPQAAAASSSSGSTSPNSVPSTAANLASENVFLQLLVAQLKNQDPEQPTDGTAFVTELAQFTTLQEDSQSATDLNKIVASLPSTTPTNPTTNTPSNTTNGINQ